MDQYSQYIALSRYARWIPEENRRETWRETVDRFGEFWVKRYPEVADKIYEACEAIFNLEVMPSMRCIMTAGAALERDEIAGYNCAYGAMTGRGKEIELYNKTIEEMVGEPIKLSLKNPICFDEFMYILLCGTGHGFSVELDYVDHMPTVGKHLSRKIYQPTQANFYGVGKKELSTFDAAANCIRVADSKYGWASAIRILVVELYNGNFPGWDLSEIRPEGAPLKTFGGRASGPQALDELMVFISDTFRGSSGKKLSALRCHDICCKIAESVIVGGVRRSATLSLSDLLDIKMRGAKSETNWYDKYPHRALANNSVAYDHKPSMEVFMAEWLALVESKAGERGIFNREAAERQVAKNGRRDTGYRFGTNPCSEILLRDRGLCNLSEVVVRAGDTFGELKRKVGIATFLGTLQATLTNFVYLHKKWRDNAKEEALLGVSLTGIMDHPHLSGTSDPSQLSATLEKLKEHSIKQNAKWASVLMINPAAAITCVKPSGTVSQLVNSASGIHPRYSEFYIRTVRGDTKDPLTQLMIAQGVPNEPARGNSSTTVFSFPIKSPEGCLTRVDKTALEQLEQWLIYQRHWCEHKPSATIYVGEHEWLEVGAWVYRNFDEVSGLAFLPRDDHIYHQAPYQEITQDEYMVAKSNMPEIDWSRLIDFEMEDTTTGTQELSCTGGVCEIADIGQ